MDVASTLKMKDATIEYQNDYLLEEWLEAIKYFYCRAMSGRPFCITPCFGAHGQLSTIVIEICGSPTIQTTTIRFFGVESCWQMLVHTPWKKRLSETYDSGINDRSRVVGVMSTIIEEVGLPGLCRTDSDYPNQFARQYHTKKLVKKYVDERADIKCKYLWERYRDYTKWLQDTNNAEKYDVDDETYFRKCYKEETKNFPQGELR